MTNQYTLRCRVCHQAIGMQYISFDRRIQKYGVTMWQGERRPTITVLLAQEMFRYDCQDCRAVHEQQIVAELKLKTTHPGSGPVTPCSRCTAPVDRSLPHVSYSYLEGEMTDWVISKVTDDTELAVLCSDCEEPDEPLSDAAVAMDIHQPERSRA
jgi:hypothetical protein